MYKKSIESIELTRTQKEVLVGTMLGDASMTKSRNKRKTAYMRIGHSIKQIEYCSYKYNFFKNMCNNGVKTVPYFNNFRQKYYVKCEFCTKFTENLYYFYDIFYKNNVKIVPEEIKEFLSPLSLAIWYQDDGSIENSNLLDKRRNRRFFRHRINLHTNSFSKTDCEKLISILATNFNLEFKLKEVAKNTSDKHYYILCARSRKTIEEFVKIVEPYIVESLKYKIKLNYPKRMRRVFDKKDLKRIANRLSISSRKDILKYRNGKKVYNSIVRLFKSFKSGLEELKK